MKREVSPIAASNFVLGRPLSELMMTRYVESRVLTSEIPRSPGTCPEAMEMAEPVMKAASETTGINSTIQPRRTKPRKRTMEPQMTASAEAITHGTFSYSGCALITLSTTVPVTVDRTATG